MSLAPNEQRRLTEIEDQLRRSDPRLAAMFARFSDGTRRTPRALMRRLGCSPEQAGRVRIIVLVVLGVALFIACVAIAVTMASHASLLQGGHGPGTSPAGTYSSGRLFCGQVILLLAGHRQEVV